MPSSRSPHRGAWIEMMRVCREKRDPTAAFIGGCGKKQADVMNNEKNSCVVPDAGDVNPNGEGIMGGVL